MNEVLPQPGGPLNKYLKPVMIAINNFVSVCRNVSDRKSKIEASTVNESDLTGQSPISPPPVRNSPLPVPRRRLDELLDVREDVVGDGPVEDDGVEGAADARVAERAPVGADHSVHHGLAVVRGHHLREINIREYEGIKVLPFFFTVWSWGPNQFRNARN